MKQALHIKQALHVAKSNLRRNKTAALSLFLIILLVSSLITISLSMLLGTMKDYRGSMERLHSAHSLFVMSREQYLPEYAEILREDPLVSEVETLETLLAGNVEMTYGGDLTGTLLVLDAAADMSVSAPTMIGQDDTVPREKAVYLPVFAQGLGYQTGDEFNFTYRNRPLSLTVAGFFESNELSIPNGVVIKIFAAPECYRQLAGIISRHVWMAVRCHDPNDSPRLFRDFTSRLDFELDMFGTDSFGRDFSQGDSTLQISILSAIILLFALLIAFISLIVTRFRVTGSIESMMHDIGVLKAAGYTSRQLMISYLMEYGLTALPASLLGVVLAIPFFSLIRRMMSDMTGITWTLGVNPGAGLLAALGLTGILLMMVTASCARIKKLPPVCALRGELAVFSFRRNFLPLHKGTGGVLSLLGLKNTFAYRRQYLMICVVITLITFVLTISGAMYDNFVLNHNAFLRMTGTELSSVELTVTRHTDAAGLAGRLEELPQVRKTTMLDLVPFKTEDEGFSGYVSDDYSRMETLKTHEGSFPIHDNEIALTRLFADRHHKKIGDSVQVRANGITLDYLITGFFSSTNNNGNVGAITLEGYRRHDMSYQRKSILVMLRDGEPIDEFIGLIKENYGVLNVLRTDDESRYAAAKIRAEEKISNYLEYYGIDSVEYSVILNGEIIMNGSSGAYQIENIVDRVAFLETQIGTYSGTIAAMTQTAALFSLSILALLLTITVRQIISKRKYELGILKAGGFTAGQLSGQLIISFIPSSLLGILTGGIAGTILTNPFLSKMFAATGVYNANMPANPLISIMLGSGTLLFIVMIVKIAAARIKHISVYELLSE